MTDEERAAPDSLRGKIDRLLGNGDEEADGTVKLGTDTGTHVPTDADDPPTTAPRRPTDPPF